MNISMTLSIQSVQTASFAEWISIWEQCPFATFYHSPYWAQIWEQYTHGKIVPDPHLIQFSDNLKIIYPFSKHRELKGLIIRYLSSPARTYGGWITSDQLTEVHQGLLEHYITVRLKNVVQRVNPYDPLNQKLERLANSLDETFYLPLEGGIDSLYKNFSGSHKTALSRSKKAGVGVRLAQNDADWETYYKIYLDTHRRWGKKATSKYEWKFFEILRDLRSPYIKLWMADHEGEDIAGLICLYAKNHVAYHAGVNLEKNLDIRPVHLLFYEAIKDACACGYRWFDFNASGGHEGVHEFKRRFGSISQACSIIDSQPGWLKWMEKTYKAWLLRTRAGH